MLKTVLCALAFATLSLDAARRTKGIKRGLEGDEYGVVEPFATAASYYNFDQPCDSRLVSDEVASDSCPPLASSRDSCVCVDTESDVDTSSVIVRPPNLSIPRVTYWTALQLRSAFVSPADSMLRVEYLVVPLCNELKNLDDMAKFRNLKRLSVCFGYGSEAMPDFSLLKEKLPDLEVEVIGQEDDVDPYSNW